MDMAVANLFKHKIRLELSWESTIGDNRKRCYRSPMLQNAEKVGASLFKPFVYYTLSKVLHEDRDIFIDYICIRVDVFGLEKPGWCPLAVYIFDTPQDYPELFFTLSEVETFPFPGYLINQPFFVCVDVCCYFTPDMFKENPSKKLRRVSSRDF